MWIEFHDSAADHRKVLKLARRLEISPTTALGHLATLWTWTLRIAPDGDLSGFDAEDIEIGAKWDGAPGLFVRAAVACRLIDEDEMGFEIHDWKHYSGSLKAAERKQAERARKRAQAQNPPPQERDSHGQSRDVTQNDRPERQDRQKETTDSPEPQVSFENSVEATRQKPDGSGDSLAVAQPRTSDTSPNYEANLDGIRTILAQLDRDTPEA
jgi:hypothetical protein